MSRQQPPLVDGLKLSQKQIEEMAKWIPAPAQIPIPPQNRLQIPICQQLRWDILLDVTIPLKATTWQRTQGKHRYTPEAVRKWEKHVQDLVLEEMAIEHIETSDLLAWKPLGLEIMLHMTPKSMKTGGDGDNYAKAIQDALCKICWKDDRIRDLRPMLANPVPSTEDSTRILIFRRV